MTCEPEITEHRFGLCPKQPVVCTSQTDFEDKHEPVYVGSPDGGGGISGSVRRGIGAALSGMKTLNQNRQLLWFAALAGLVLAGNTIGQSSRYFILWNTDLQLGIMNKVLVFFIEFATMFCLVFLLAGLFLSIPQKKGVSSSFFAGLAGAKKYLKPIFLWSFILAFAGMLLVEIFTLRSLLWWPHELSKFNLFGYFYNFLFSTLSQFPFNLSLRWDLFTEIPGYGGRSVLFWIYPGLVDTLIISAINLLLLILTLFVVPLIVLEQKTLREAVAGSFALMKKIRVEAAACVVFIGVLVFGVFLVYMLVEAAHGMLAPLEVISYRPSATWTAIGIFYDFILFSVAFVMATVGGIAVLDLYNSAKSRQEYRS
ncbi:hypothetical protein [Methanolacinia paynteri]|uniref:hypothetical protein n=1 Tax=Methanolacinia paynteri TaxID=230356 RepID=UPI00064F4086|nr:hypothetical protein [Methanolacinia paynteri]